MTAAACIHSHWSKAKMQYTVKYPNEKMSCGERVTLWEMRTKSLVREFFVRRPFRSSHDISFAKLRKVKLSRRHKTRLESLIKMGC